MSVCPPTKAGYSEASLQSCSRGNMSQRSIKSFFTPKSGDSVKKTEDGNGANSIKKKKLVIDSDSEDVQDSKENIPNAQSSAAPADADIKKPVAESGNVEENTEDLPETNLDLSVPYRKTARKAFKRKSDAEQLQEQKIKKLKSESPKQDEPKQEPVDIKTENVTVEEEKPSPTPMECENSLDSPVKKTKTKKNRIVSDSEDDNPKKSAQDSPARKKSKSPSPEKEKTKPVSPEKVKTENKKESTKTFSIFNVKKSPSKSTASINSNTKTTGKSNSSSKKSSPSKKSPSPSKSKSPKESSKTKTPSPKKSPSSTDVPEESPKPSTSGTQEKPKPKNPFQGFFGPKSKTEVKTEGKDYDKKVKKSQYHPIDDCFWKRGEKTPFLALANTLLAIEETSGRLKTIEILSNYFRSVMVQSPNDLIHSIYFVLNKLAPAWEGLELGIGETILMKAIANTTGSSFQHIKAEFSKHGDLGIVAETSKSSQKTMFQPAPLNVENVFSRIKDLALMTGNASSTKKVEKIQSLLVACRGSEARFLIRSINGKLRIGLAEQSVLQALAQACLQTPVGQEYPPATHTAFKSSESDSFKEKLAPLALKLKSAFCECPTYDILIPELLKGGIDGLSERCKLTPGIPLRPMLAHPTKGVQEVLTRFENCKFTCEWKYDGERAQVHLHEDGRISIFSRNQENNTSKYPDIISRFPACLSSDVKSAILDCEAVAWDREKKTIQPFQVLSTRKRKDAVESEIKVQVCLFGFDLLYLNGESFTKHPFQERRALLREKFQEVEGEFYYAKGIDGTTTEEIQEALEESIKDNCEGLMVKTLDREATYEIARRSHNWLKLKKDYLDGVGDTMDLVVIGGYLGKGKRTGRYGGFLLACYDPENEEYQSICKIGTGFSDEDLQKHATFFKDQVTEKPKSYYNFDPTHSPDHWFEPVQVWEVKCADLSVSPAHKAAIGIVDPSKGVSLRFPRFIRIRDDKNPEDATSAEQIAEMYNNQDQIKNQNKDKAASAEDDFDF